MVERESVCGTRHRTRKRTADAAHRFRQREKALRAATLIVTSLWKTGMPDTKRTMAVLIREDTPLPASLSIESEAFFPGWRLIKDLDGSGLDRKIREAGWTFFYLAGETRATVFGIDGEKMVRRAIEQILGNRILANAGWEKFNSLEITQLASVASKRFLGVHHVTVSARSRHIQQGIGPVPVKDVVLRMPAAAPESWPGRGAELHHGEAAPKQHAALSSSF
jgi:hypothetical protein